MAWVAVGTMVAGTAASIGGGILSRNDALSNAQAQAAARNASLAANIGKLNTMEDQNQGIFGGNMARYAPDTQAAQLATAQQTRGDANAGAISAPDTSGVPIQSDASPATRSDLAKRMGAVHDAATTRAKAMGTLGGYGDTWAANTLGNAQANRDIGVVNNAAEGRKALIQPESDMAAAAAYKPPSIWGPLLSGAGSIAAAAGGAGIGGGAGAGGAGASFGKGF